MNTLTVDIGNTRTKYELWDDSGYVGEVKGEEEHLIPSIVKEGNIKGAIVSSVSEDPSYLVVKLKNYIPKVVDFNQEEIRKYGEKICYKGSVGADRIAAYLGALALCGEEAMLIVDAGTAITLDIADSKGNYRGGNISAGLNTRLKSLAVFTGRLPKVEVSSHYISFGDDTVSSLQSGAINGVLGEIKFASFRGEKEYGVRKTIITGGDSELIYSFLREDMDCMHCPYLVGKGLDSHLRKFYL